MLEDSISQDELPGLIEHAKSGNSDAFAAVFKRYRRHVYRLANGYFAPGADRDDLLQEAAIGFFKAIRDYNPARRNFDPFMVLCVRRQLITFVRQSTRPKHRPLNRSISIDAQLNHDSIRTMSDYLSAPDTSSELLESRFSATIEAVAALCSPLEREILLLYTRGHKYADIASHLQITPKAIHNALWRAKEKALRSGVCSF